MKNIDSKTNKPLFIYRTCSLFKDVDTEVNRLEEDAYLLMLIEAVNNTDIEPIVCLEISPEEKDLKIQNSRIEVDIL